MKPGVDYIGITTSFVCTDGKGRILMHKRSKNCRDEQGAWDPGGGKLEFGAVPAENCLKEISEEYGCAGEIVVSPPPLSIFRNFDGIDTHWLAIPFFVKVDPQTAKIGEPEKMDEIGWFTLDSLPQPLHKGFQQILAAYRPELERALQL